MIVEFHKRTSLVPSIYMMWFHSICIIQWPGFSAWMHHYLTSELSCFLMLLSFSVMFSPIEVCLSLSLIALKLTPPPVAIAISFWPPNQHVHSYCQRKDIIGCQQHYSCTECSLTMNLRPEIKILLDSVFYSAKVLYTGVCTVDHWQTPSLPMLVYNGLLRPSNPIQSRG